MRLGQRLFGFVSDSFWVDVGELRGYLQGITWVLQNLAKEPPTDSRVVEDSNKSVFASGQITIGQSTRVLGPTWIEKGTFLGDNVQVNPSTVLKQNSQNLSGTTFEAGIAFEKSIVGQRCTIHSTIIGERAII